MMYNYGRIDLIYLIFHYHRFSPLYPKTIWPSLVLSCFFDDIHIFGGEILACKPVFIQWVILILTAVLEINGGREDMPIFNPFPASLSNSFVKKLLIVLSSCGCKSTDCLSPAFT